MPMSEEEIKEQVNDLIRPYKLMVNFQMAGDFTSKNEILARSIKEKE